MTDLVEFDEIAVQKGFVRVLKPLLNPYLARLRFLDTSGNWIEDSDTPAIYLGYSNNVEPNNPKIHITFNGDSNLGNSVFESGITVIEDPFDAPNLIEVPYRSSYLSYVLTLTADSGLKDAVNRGEVKSASWLLRHVRDNLMFSSFRDSIHTEMHSTVQTMSNVTPAYDLEDTEFHDAAVMRLTFNAISTVFELGGSFITTVNYTGCLKDSPTDTDPSIYTDTIVSVQDLSLAVTESSDVVSLTLTT